MQGVHAFKNLFIQEYKIQIIHFAYKINAIKNLIKSVIINNLLLYIHYYNTLLPLL